ncbi:MAG: pantetheine-phosphate adenylyltransferase [Vicinamibacteria bacterium]|nr:pantetheine-phosphate adenylyltransferase [Vicinamibacteria bacterium]
MWRRIALVPGSFDPVTLGHLDLVIRASSLFDEVVVAVLENASKQPWFSAAGRVLMVQREMAALKNVRVVRFSGLLADLAAQHGAEVVVRGVRGGSDLEYETLMARMNAHLRPGLDTVFLPSSPQLTHIASRLVREIAYLGGSVQGLVSEKVAMAMETRAEEKRAEHAFTNRGAE